MDSAATEADTEEGILQIMENDPPPDCGKNPSLHSMEPKHRNGRELSKIVWVTGAVHGFLAILSIPFLASMEQAFQLNGYQMLGLPIFATVVGFVATGLQLAGSGCATKMVGRYRTRLNGED